MKSNKGFTLIELLAVIVILAIIALIATPIILDVIDTARKGAKESSALGYVDAVEKQVMLAQVDTSATKIPAGTYKVSDLSQKLGVEIKGEGPKGYLSTDSEDGVVKIATNGSVEKAWLIFDSYYVTYTGNNGKAVASNDAFTDEPTSGFCNVTGTTVNCGTGSGI